MISTFSCPPTKSRISVAQCVSLYTIGKKPAWESDRLRTSHCRACAVGEAHARGETPTHWPDGSVIERGTTTPVGEAARLAANPPTRSEDLMAKTTTGRTIEHAGKSLTIDGWARELGVTPTAIRARIGRGWTELEAVSTPQGKVPARVESERAKLAKPPQRAAEVEPPVPVARTKAGAKAPSKRTSASKPLVSSADVAEIARALDPVELLARLGYTAELVGETPKGRLVLVSSEAPDVG